MNKNKNWTTNQIAIETTVDETNKITTIKPNAEYFRPKFEEILQKHLWENNEVDCYGICIPDILSELIEILNDTRKR